MKTYLVGGAIRDKLLGLPIKERDYVVVNASVSDMLALGFRQVGKEFPVFLHPKTNEEYALARMERKVKPGYQGFTFDTSQNVTLEEDLIRRDLTVNAIAEAEDGTLIDPYGGQNDLKAKLLRHVSPAFTEDPVRILRVARFYARFASLGFRIAPETILLMKSMVKNGEVNALVAERVWKECERALAEKNPEKFFETLALCDALPLLFPGIEMDGPGIKALMAASTQTDNPSVRFAALFYATNQPLQEVSHRLRPPNYFKELAQLVASLHEKALHANELSAADLLSLFNTLDSFRREPRFLDFLAACRAIATALQQPFDPAWLKKVAAIAKVVDVEALIANGLTGKTLANAIQETRLEQISHCLKQ